MNWQEHCITRKLILNFVHIGVGVSFFFFFFLKEHKLLLLFLISKEQKIY